MSAAGSGPTHEVDEGPYRLDTRVSPVEIEEVSGPFAGEIVQHTCQMSLRDFVIDIGSDKTAQPDAVAGGADYRDRAVQDEAAARINGDHSLLRLELPIRNTAQCDIAIADVVVIEKIGRNLGTSAVFRVTW